MSPSSTSDNPLSDGVPVYRDRPLEQAGKGFDASHQVRTVREASYSSCQSGTGAPNGASNGVRAQLNSRKPSRVLTAPDPESVHDLVCVGFGPASLAIAVALHDALEAGTLEEPPRVLFLERQAQFSWHAGMLLPGAKMQISFIKDLATLRDPRSRFTFLNYLHENDRLVDFINLSTFLPARTEYEDYLRWCASHFEQAVKYHTEVLSVSPVEVSDGPLNTFAITSKNIETGNTTTHLSRNVLIAIGGQPSVPKYLPAGDPRIIHSSQYANLVPEILTDRSAPYRVAVLGAGQSAAEIFNNIQDLYPQSRTWLIMRSEFLKPSDDSPFVNTIFNPDFIDTLYPCSSEYRRNLIMDARATNYGVVRLELIEQLYEKMYHQRRELGRDERHWRHRIMGGRQVLNVKEGSHGLQLMVCAAPPGVDLDGPVDVKGEEVLDVDLVICATGYQRKAHLEMLKDTWSLLPESQQEPEPEPLADGWYVQVESDSNDTASSRRVLEVGRDYGVRFARGAVAPGSGVWLQGCCEGSHGISDTLLSVLATRSEEIVESIFGQGRRSRQDEN